MKDFYPSRKNILLEQIVLVDGQPACGKGALDPAISSMRRVELLNFSPQIENICGLRYLNKLDNNSAKTMLRLEADLVLYETMMSRNTNFRINDQSSAFKDINFITYIKRLFVQGDSLIPKKIIKDKPILHFMTHAMLGVSKPLFEAFQNKLNIIELVRHPKSMLEKQTEYNEWWSSNAGKKRQFQLFINYKNNEIPFWAKDWPDLYIKSNSVERAIFEMSHQIKVAESFKKENSELFKKQCLSIPFERFVVNPIKYLKKVEILLNTEISKKTNKMLKKESVPRKNQNINENKIMKFLDKKGASKDSIELLNKISQDYENYYL